MRVGIIGAGVAGLTTAKALTQAGHDVVVWDSAPDVGGVWGRTRRYPGLCTQSPKAQYAFSDFPMPRDYPEWPDGAQIQAWLEAYAEHFGILDRIHLDTNVESADPRIGGGWDVRVSSAAESTTEQIDCLVVANGIFSRPSVPEYPGLDEFRRAGGRLLAATELHDAEDGRDKHVLVVGYGKTACDVTVPLSKVAASTDVIARQLLWKVPRKIAGKVNFKMLLLTRMGEALFPYHTTHGVESFFAGPGNGMRRSMLNSIGSVSVRQFKLAELDLLPAGAMEDIVKGAIGLATEGFFEGVADGTISVRRDTTITRLGSADGRPVAELADGTALPADLVVCATGFVQDVPFLPDAVQAKIFDERGNFMLYRQIQPVGVPDLYFNGYNSSFFSPLNAEAAALWVAADLAGALDLPNETTRRDAVVRQIAFMDVANDGHHSRAAKIIPFSLHNLDEVLGDLGVNIAAPVRATHWLNPVDPKAYRKLTAGVIARVRVDSEPPTAGDVHQLPVATTTSTTDPRRSATG